MSNIVIVFCKRSSYKSSPSKEHPVKNFGLALLCSLAFVAMSCNNAVEFTADQLTVAGIAAQPGYAWFNGKVAAYTPAPANVAAIQSAYAADPFNTIIYVNPSCSCDGTQFHFPDLVKTLRSAGIPDSTVTIFSMRNAETKQPYSDIYPVKSLPTFYFVHTSKKVISVVPADGTNSGIDSMVVKAFN